MKFPSFIRTTKYSRFEYTPRYYDPIKEEIEMKMAMAKKDLENGKKSHSSSISGAFARRERKSNQSSIIQFIIAISMVSTVFGWLFYGNDIFYIYLVISPLYFFFRLKTRTPKRDNV